MPANTTSLKRISIRAVMTIVAAFVVVVAESYASPGWYAELLHRLHPPPKSSLPKSVVRPGPIGPRAIVTPMRPAGNDSSLSPVPQALVLVRTQLGRNIREGFAQIGIQARSPQTYSAGALLANGARLTEIHDRYVVLEREGHAARLYLQGEPHQETRSERSVLTVGGAPEQAVLTAQSRDDLTAYVRPNPVFVGNLLHGFILHPGRRSGAYSQIGLLPDDVLTQVNGSPISDASGALAILQTLLDGRVLTVEVERQGIPQILSLDGSVWARDASAKTDAKPAYPMMTHEPIFPPRLLTKDQ